MLLMMCSTPFLRHVPLWLHQIIQAHNYESWPDFCSICLSALLAMEVTLYLSSLQVHRSNLASNNSNIRKYPWILNLDPVHDLRSCVGILWHMLISYPVVLKPNSPFRNRTASNDWINMWWGVPVRMGVLWNIHLKHCRAFQSCIMFLFKLNLCPICLGGYTDQNMEIHEMAVTKNHMNGAHVS